MTDPTTPAAAEGFEARVQRMHVPEPNADRERMLLWAGFALVVVGLVVVAVGWFGASGTSDPSVQIPYAISGGAGGLGLIVIGAALITRFSLARLFRYWLARIVYEHQAQTDRTVEALGRIEAALTGGPAPTATIHPPSEPAVGDVSAAPEQPPVDGAGAGGTTRRRKEPLRAEPLEG